MPRQYFYDVPGGDTILYDVVDESNGYRQGTFQMPEETRYDHFNSIRNVQCKEDDIFLNSYPKTAAEKKLKTILLCRNPKDVAVSFYNHTKGIKPYEYSGKFENYLQMFVRGEVDFGSYPEYLMEWQQHIRDHPDVPFHIVYYEDLKEDCCTELKKLRDFLGLEASDDLIKEIADNCSVNKMRENKSKKVNEETAKQMAQILNPGFNLIRKGQIGDWKNWFTVAQNEMFDAWWGQETKALDMFKFRYV